MRIKRVLVAAAIPLVVAAPWWGPLALRQFRFFEVRRIEVVGARYLAPATVVGALGLKAGASVWSDLSGTERRVRTLGGVASAKVSRRLPATLVVAVAEVEPVALAAGPTGLVPIAPDGRPLPYDPATAPVDAPVVPSAVPVLVAALATVRSADPALFADVAAARRGGGGGGEVVLELDGGRLLLEAPVDPTVVRAMSAVRRDLGSRGRSWKELDGRYRGWVVVRGLAPETRPAVRRPRRSKVA